MFFQGTLQEGIATALQQQKLVVCFVTDEGDESQMWEADYLSDNAVKSPLEHQAIMLRLAAGSEEAGYLEALFPVPMKPTVVFIQSGQLKEYIVSGTPKDEFLRRALTALGSQAATSTQAAAASSQSTPQSGPQPVGVSPAPQDHTGDTPASSGSTAQNARIQAMLAERAKRLEKEKKAQEAKEKAETEARAKARREESEGPETSGIKASEKAHAKEVKERKQKAKEDRRRILQRIEDDKRERKERLAKEKQARLLASAQEAGENQADAPAPLAPGQVPLSSLSSSFSKTGGGDHCNIQVRLFDGSTMRARFPSSATLATDVRQWIDAERTDVEAKGPYNFRVVLSPLPNRSISSEEESQTLLSLGLAPSATVVLAPRASASALAKSGGGILSSIVAFFALLWASLMTIVGLGNGGAASTSINSNVSGSGAASPISPSSGSSQGFQRDFSGSGNSDELRRRRNNNKGKEKADEVVDDPQLYNGNSLNFEPRRDDDDEDDHENQK